MKKKLLLTSCCLAAAMTSVAKNGITWEGVFQPLTTYQNDCSKNITELGHPKAVSDCEGVISYDTLVTSTQSEKYDECGHYIYDVYYSVVATDECGNTDTLPILTEHYGKGLDTTPLQTGMQTKEGFREIDGITADTIEITSNYGGNCTFLMPNVQNLFAIPKCGVGSMLLVEQSIEAGKPLTETLIVDVNLRNFCQNYGTLKVKVNVPKKDSIVKLTTMRSCHIIGNEPLNLASERVSKTEGYVWEYYQGEYLTVPSTILTDYYKGGVWEDSLVYSNNIKTYGNKFAGLTPEQKIDKLTLKDSTQNDYYYIVAMDTTTGCTDTAATYINVVEIKSGIVWIKRPAYQEIETPYCQPVDLLLPDTMAIAKSSCSDVAIRVITVSDQDPSDSACGHYIYNVRYYLEASDSCGNIDSLWVATLHVNYEKPHVSNELIDIPADYAKACEFAIPDATKNHLFSSQQFCGANLKISQNIAPGTLITKDTSLLISFADACKNYGTVYSVKVFVPDMIIKATAPESFNYVTAYGYIPDQEPLSLIDVFQANGISYIYGEPVPATILQKFYKKVENGEDIEILYPYTVKGDSPEDSGYYYMVATDTASGCSDTAISKITFEIVVSSPVIANEQGEKKVSIYTPSGIVVGKDVYFKDVMNELKNGLYIVNDKKYYLKK